MEERIGLFREYDTGFFTVSELCNRHGISRETFYVWQRRRASGDADWFEARSHAATICPHATDGRLADRLNAVRRQFAHFGPKKVKGCLEDETRRRQSCEVWPAASTMGDIQQRAGLVAATKRRRQAIAQGEIVAPATVANE